MEKFSFRRLFLFRFLFIVLSLSLFVNEARSEVAKILELPALEICDQTLEFLKEPDSSQYSGYGFETRPAQVKRRDMYATMTQAMAAARGLGIRTWTEYHELYKLDPRLPSTPERVYEGEWKGYEAFLNPQWVEPVKPYETLQEAATAVAKLGIKSRAEYYRRYKLDPRLPSSPDRTYSSDWRGYRLFFDPSKIGFYETIAQASAATRKLGIRSIREYRERYKLDKRLPSTPQAFYSQEWKDFETFLDPMWAGFYPTLDEARTAVKKLGVQSREDYSKLHKLDKRLPNSLEKFYASEWKDFRIFLNPTYPTMAEAMAAVQKLGIKKRSDYVQRYKLDDRLPARPDLVYESEWQGIKYFLGSRR